MAQKILVADDSVTIQKVIKITLANDPVEIVECLDEASLMDTLSSDSFDLVLLDFNLSQETKGYELAKRVHESSSNSSIMVLLGTFDTIDEDLMKKSFIEDKVVKPFESKEFISKVRSLLSTKEIVEEVDEEDQWVVDAPQPEEVEDEIDDKEYDIEPNQLSKEISGWAMEVPGVIGEKKSEPTELPPILESKEEAPSSVNEVSVYDVEEIEEMEVEKEEVPIDASSTLEDDITSDSNPEDFWTTDEEISEDEFEFKLDEPAMAKTPMFNPDASEDPVHAEVSAPLSADFETELREKVTPIIEELVKKYCEQTIQKVAWEVIPDLAENLIRKELQEISRSIE